MKWCSFKTGIAGNFCCFTCGNDYLESKHPGVPLLQLSQSLDDDVLVSSINRNFMSGLNLPNRDDMLLSPSKLQEGDVTVVTFSYNA